MRPFLGLLSVFLVSSVLVLSAAAPQYGQLPSFKQQSSTLGATRLTPVRIVAPLTRPDPLLESVQNIQQAFQTVAGESRQQDSKPDASVPHELVVPQGPGRPAPLDGFVEPDYTESIEQLADLSSRQSGITLHSMEPAPSPAKSTVAEKPPSAAGKATILLRLTELHDAAAKQLDFARQLAEKEEAQARKRAIARRKARRLRGETSDDDDTTSDDQKDDDINDNNDGEAVVADTQPVGDNEDLTSTVDADTVQTTSADSNQPEDRFVQELTDVLRGTATASKAKKRKHGRRKRLADYSSMFGDKDPVSALLDVLKDDKRATMRFAAESEAKKSSIQSVAASNNNQEVPGYSLPAPSEDKTASSSNARKMRFTAQREPGWSMPVPTDSDPTQPVNTLSSGFGLGTPPNSMNMMNPNNGGFLMPNPMQIPQQPQLIPNSPSSLSQLQLQLQLQQQTQQLQSQISLQQTLQQQQAVLQQQQQLNSLANAQNAVPSSQLTLSSPPPLAASQTPPSPAQYFAQQAYNQYQQQQQQNYPPQIGQQPSSVGYSLLPMQNQGPPPIDNPNLNNGFDPQTQGNINPAFPDAGGSM
jgi:hypothetical protein